MSGVLDLEAHLRARRAEGRKLLVPYVTGGLGHEWCDVVRAVVDAGADAVEVGIPFSDPIMDGRTIQEASQRALDLGATPIGVIDALAEIDAPVPLIVMTYYNLIGHMGHERAATRAAAGRRRGAILPDLPLDELDGWGDAADAARRRDRAPRRAHDTRRPSEGDLRTVARVRLRRVAARGDRRARRAARARRDDGQAVQGGHRPAGAARGRASRRPNRPRRPPRTPTV